MIVQIFIAIFGVTAVMLSQLRDENLRKWAPIVGLCAQPFWFVATYQAEQWGIFLLAFFYTYAWCVGLKNYWWRPVPTLTDTV